MDGKSLLYDLRQILNEGSDSDWLDSRSSYTYLHLAAVEFVDRTESLRATQSITTVADQTGYTLNADFMRLYLRDQEHEYYIKYNDGSSNTFLKFEDYQKIILDDQTTSVSTPERFSIIDDSTLDSQVTGTATSTAASSGGQAILTDTAADFSDVSAGDVVHNTTDGSDGFVLSKTSSTVLVVALFGGTANDWTSSDAYVIQPQGRLKLVLDAPPSTAGHTVTVEYVQRPPIVASDYGAYRIQSHYQQALVQYAVFLYKYRDREANFGDSLFVFFDREVRRSASSLNKALGRQGFRVNWKKRR